MFRCSRRALAKKLYKDSEKLRSKPQESLGSSMGSKFVRFPKNVLCVCLMNLPRSNIARFLLMSPTYGETEAPQVIAAWLNRRCKPLIQNLQLSYETLDLVFGGPSETRASRQMQTVTALCGLCWGSGRQYSSSSWEFVGLLFSKYGLAEYQAPTLQSAR